MVPQLSTVANAGLPAGYRKKTPNGNARMGAGVMFLSKDGKALFLRRNGKGDHAGKWAFPGGHVEEDEEPADAARREAMEETGYLNGWGLSPVDRSTKDDIDFTTFGQPVASEFEPTLNDEHDAHEWRDLSDPPEPLHPGVAALLARFFAEEAEEPEHAGMKKVDEGATDSALQLAMDKSVRSFDTDGRMRVSHTNLSKATVNPYRGDEIPNWEQLGLQADRVYQMYRPAKELKAGAATFNSIQLLKKHVPVDVEDHKMWDIVGCTGSDAAFDGTYLTNSLSVWTKEAIDFIESGEQRELSCGYHYVPVMTAGMFDGKPYDGIMTEIEGNHVALVEEGRAGHDVVVGDSALSERESEMKPTRLEHAVLTRTAAAINPLLAIDAKVDYGPIIKGLTTKNIRQRKPQIVEGVRKAIKGKTIAKDASIEHLAKMLDHFQDAPASADESVSGPQHRAMEAAAHGHSTLGIPKNVGEEFSEKDKGKTFGDMIRDWASAKDWAAGMTDDDFSALDKMHSDCRDQDMGASDMEGEKEVGEIGEHEEGGFDRGAKDKRSAKDRKRARDEFPPKEDDEEKEGEDESEEERERDEEEAEDDAGESMFGMHAKDRKGGAKDRKGGAKDKAMDSKPITQDAVNKMIEEARVQERRRAKAANEAREFVRPYVGSVSMAFDSAEQILRAGAKALEIENVDKLHVDALKPLIKVYGQRRATGDQGGPADDMAMDTSTTDDGVATFNEMFGADRIKAV
jgi:8-oxo-dGTP pyrophosphatase MutT (NUDIX family)